MTSSSLYLVRHGAIVRPSARTYIGHIDAPLSKEGIDQARALHRWLQPVQFARVISSDLKRAQHTARIIAGDRLKSMETLSAFREINLGEWEGQAFSEIEQRFPAEYAARGRDLECWRPPGGENFADCRTRVMAALRVILESAQGNILLVAHAGVNRLILCDTLGVPMSRLHSVEQDYGCLNIIEFSVTQTRLKFLNLTPPTGQPIPEFASAGELSVLLGKKGN